MSNSLQRNNQPPQVLPERVEYIPRDDFHDKDENSLNPRKILSLLFKYKWIVLAFLLIAVVGAWVYADVQTPIYESSGSLMISSNGQSPSDQLSKIISQSTGYSTSSTIENEMQVLSSNRFSEQVAQKLLDNKPENIKEFPIYWQQTEDGERVRASKNKIAGRIKRNISFLKPEEKADVINVNYKSSSSKESAKIVNLAMHHYITQSKQQNRQAATSTANFLEGEKKKLKKKLHDAEQALQNYMDATGIVKVNEQASSMVTQRAHTGAELQQVTLELKAAKRSIADYKKRLNEISPGLTEQMKEAVGPRIKSSQKLMAQYEQERELIIAKNPGVQKRDPLPPRLQYLNKQIARLKEKIKQLSSKSFTKDNEFAGINSNDRAKIVSDLQSKLAEQKVKRNQLESRKKALTQNKNKMDAKFNTLPRGMVKLAKLKRNVKINEELYTNVSKEYADVSVLEQSKFGLGRIIDSADVPHAPVSPNKKIYMLLGLMLGGFLAAGYIAVSEFRDNSVHDIGELKSVYLPPVSIIQKIEKEGNKKSFNVCEGTIPKEVVMLNDRSSVAAESIRRLKNNIIFQNEEAPPKSIAITSPEKGDGKSTISANLAIAFAEEGYWTLVVDADFRRPKLHKFFGMKNDSGLSNYLNKEISFENLLKETDLETLKLITAGRGADTPEILANNHKLKHLLIKMEEVFDLIIIDTPPYGVVSDSTALIKYAEATVLVAQYQKTNKGMLLNTMEELKHIHANVTNIVLNNFDYRNGVNNYYGAGYYQAMYDNYDQYLST